MTYRIKHTEGRELPAWANRAFESRAEAEDLILSLAEQQDQAARFFCVVREKDDLPRATVCDHRTGRTIEADAEVTDELLEICSRQANRDRGVLAVRDPGGYWRYVSPDECEPGEPHPTGLVIELSEE